MLKFLQFLVVILFSQLTYAQDFDSAGLSSGRSSSVVATVNGDPITDLDVTKRIRLIALSSGIQANQQALKVLRPQVIHMMIDEKLINQEAAKVGVEADELELGAAMDEIAGRSNMNSAQFAEFLKHRGIDKSSLEEQVKNQILWSEIVATKIRPMVQVNSHEVEQNEEFIRKSRKNQAEKIEQVKLAEIVIFATEKDLEKQMQFAKKLSADLKAGVDFAKVAKEFSLASSAGNGGEIGWVYADQLAPEISMQVSKLNKGGVTSPIISQDGIHIFKVLDLKKKASSGKEIISEEQVRDAILEQKVNLEIRTYLNKIRQNAYIKIN